mgnify:CR=1 FL=1
MINEYINKVIKSICNIDVNRLIADLSTRKQEIISLNEQLMHLRNVNNSNTTRIIQLESTIDIQKNKINTLQSLNVELSDMLESNRADISSLQNERNNLFQVENILSLEYFVQHIIEYNTVRDDVNYQSTFYQNNSSIYL